MISINRRRVLTARLDQVKAKLIDFLYPPRCVGCGNEGSFVCACCEASLPRLTSPLCSSCGQPLAGSDRCPQCRTWRPETDGIRSPFAFDGVLRQAIYQFKYGHFKALAAPLGQLLGSYLQKEPLPVDVVVPVPLHSSRERDRGYNQAALLAAELGRECGLPVVGDCLVRLRHTRPQVRTAGALERQHNLAGAFGCLDQRLEGQRVLLVDDVCTTGATLSSCAAALKKAGASLVWGLALARET